MTGRRPGAMDSTPEGARVPMTWGKGYRCVRLVTQHFPTTAVVVEAGGVEVTASAAVAAPV